MPASDLGRRVSRAVIWNVVSLPFLALATLGLSVLMRRGFGLSSGSYDVALALALASLRYSSAGIPRSLSKFLPEVGVTSGSGPVRRFLAQAATIRLVLLGLVLLPLNLFAPDVARGLSLDPPGELYVYLASGLAIGRAVIDLSVATLNAFFAQLFSNVIALVKATLDALLVGVALVFGFELTGALGGLVASALVVAVASSVFVVRRLDRMTEGDRGLAARGESPAAFDRRCILARGVAPRSNMPNILRRLAWRARRLAGFGAQRDFRHGLLGDKPAETGGGSAWLAGEGTRFARFSSFVYLTGLLGFFGRMAFVAPALAFIGGTADVAVFATAYNLAFTTMTAALAGFRGVSQPLLARLRLRDDSSHVRRTFAMLTKGQLLVLLPAGVVVTIMCADYIPLLFGSDFHGSVPLARILIGSMYLSSVLNVSRIVLTVDERYRDVLMVRLVPVVMAPLFFLAAAWAGLVGAAVVLGGAQVLASVLAYRFCRRAYGVRFPWAFAGRAGVAVGGMGVTLAFGLWALDTTFVGAASVTLIGAAVFVVGLRVGNVLGPSEVKLLERSGVRRLVWVARHLAPSTVRPAP